MEFPAAMGTCTFRLSQGDRLGDALSTTSSPSIVRFGEAPSACPHGIRISRTDGLNNTRSGRDISRLSASVSMMSRQFPKKIKERVLNCYRKSITERRVILIHQQVEHGVEGVIIGGRTVEGQLMNWAEHIMLIPHTVHYFGKEIEVQGNTGSNSTREATYATEQGFAVGIHGSLQINPYYGKTSNTGVLAHFESLLPFGPTIIYNVPP